MILELSHNRSKKIEKSVEAWMKNIGVFDLLFVAMVRVVDWGNDAADIISHTKPDSFSVSESIIAY